MSKTDCTASYRAQFQPTVDMFNTDEVINSFKSLMKKQGCRDITHVNAKLEVSREDSNYRYDFKIQYTYRQKIEERVHWDSPKTQTVSHTSHNNIITWSSQPWAGCCALTMMMYLRLGYNVANWFREDREFTERFFTEFTPAFKQSFSRYHKAIFAYSDEEVPYQHSLSRKLGFRTTGMSPFSSVKSQHRIRMTELLLVEKEEHDRLNTKYAAKSGTNGGVDDDGYGDEDEAFL